MEVYDVQPWEHEEGLLLIIIDDSSFHLIIFEPVQVLSKATCRYHQVGKGLYI